MVEAWLLKKSLEGETDQIEMPAQQTLYSHPRVSWARQLLNLIGCLLIFPLYRAAAVNTYFPATVDLLISILLAEFCRYNNESKRIAFSEVETLPSDKGDEDVEKQAFSLVSGRESSATCEAVAAVVGWREDPDLWRRCLESYRAASCCKFVLVGIDGDDADDEEMVEIFKKVRML